MGCLRDLKLYYLLFFFVGQEEGRWVTECFRVGGLVCREF